MKKILSGLTLDLLYKLIVIFLVGDFLLIGGIGERGPDTRVFKRRVHRFVERQIIDPGTGPNLDLGLHGGITLVGLVIADNEAAHDIEIAGGELLMACSGI